MGLETRHRFGSFERRGRVGGRSCIPHKIDEFKATKLPNATVVRRQLRRRGVEKMIVCHKTIKSYSPRNISQNATISWNF